MVTEPLKHGEGNLTEIPTCEKQKNRENTYQRKQSHAQDNIYMVRQFVYAHGVTGILLLSGKSTIHSAATRIFHSIKNTATNSQ